MSDFDGNICGTCYSPAVPKWDRCGKKRWTLWPKRRAVLGRRTPLKTSPASFVMLPMGGLNRRLAGATPFGTGPSSIAKIMAAVPPPPPSLISASQFVGLGQELYALIVRCLAQDPTTRITADDLISACSALCYSIDQYETGTISGINSSTVSFIVADSGGKGLMYHRDSVYGDTSRSKGDKLWFGRHPGGGNDRAFPVVKRKVAAAPPVA